MNFPQLKRLALVLLIPLLLFGFWAAENELFIENHYTTLCENYDTPSCYSSRGSNTEMYEWIARQDELERVALETDSYPYKAYLKAGLAEPVQLLDYSGEKKGGLVNLIFLTKGRCGLNMVYHHFGYIDLNPKRLGAFIHDTPQKVWQLSCHGSGLETSLFQFARDEDDAKYTELMSLLNEIIKNNNTKELLLYALNAAFPLFIFILIPTLFFIVSRVCFYVKYGK